MDTPTASDQTPIDPSIYWERSGVLARASTQGALFSLYLAMQQHSVAEPFEIDAAPSAGENRKSIESQLASLNHYRRPSLAASESEWENMHAFSSLVSQNYASARLHLCMKPPPLAQIDDAKRIPDDVMNNCSLATQKRLKKQVTNTLKEDNTLLYDILSSHNGNRDSNDVFKKDAYIDVPSFENIA
ncbi:hypothetical protein KUL156_10700 [Alteromonas sp. KUL156]|nr:hypothetical protein KUL154_28180 [Alteromonas sp. KUL154]GFD98477.1 hypothetical protein KUL156_10700 [Alteromonas sp. KUL156]